MWEQWLGVPSTTCNPTRKRLEPKDNTLELALIIEIYVYTQVRLNTTVAEQAPVALAETGLTARKHHNNRRWQNKSIMGHSMLQ